MSHRTALLSAVLGASLAVVAGGAQAGDAAARRIIGFSPDGHYFAFEQYGTLDWSESHSGWSEIAVIDTQTDQFVGGNPIRVGDVTSDSTLTLQQARAQAAARAAPVLAKLAIAARGDRRAFDRFTFPDDMVGYNDIPRLEQAAQKELAPIYDDLEVTTIQLDQILADSATDCSASFEPAQPGAKTGKALGFRLTLGRANGKPSVVLHEDKAVPASRDCPVSYSLSEAYAFEPKGKPAVVAVLVQRFSQGYEGRDRRFIAITGQIR